MQFPLEIWRLCIHPCCATPTLVALGCTCSSQRNMVLAGLSERWGDTPSTLLQAVKRLHGYFKAHLSVAHRRGLRYVSRKFLDGNVSGLTMDDILEYEKVMWRRCTLPQQRELRSWTVVHYQSERGPKPWRLTVDSILRLLFSGPGEPIHTIFISNHRSGAHRLTLYCRKNGTYYLPQHVHQEGETPGSFYSWGYYCRMTSTHRAFEEHAQLTPTTRV